MTKWIQRTGALLTILTIADVVATSAPSFATMPELTSPPKTATPLMCRQWAVTQSDDSVDMWGTQGDGTSSKSSAIDRLTLSCLGKKPPDIVYFYSSIGVAEEYCQKNSQQKVCRDLALGNVQKPRVLNPPPPDAVFDTRYTCLYGKLEEHKVSNRQRAAACDKLGELEKKALDAGYCWNQMRGEYRRCETR